MNDKDKLISIIPENVENVLMALDYYLENLEIDNFWQLEALSCFFEIMLINNGSGKTKVYCVNARK